MPPSPPTGDRILPHTNVLLRLPSGAPKIIRISPDTTISLGKFGQFPSNALLHRPYNLTYDILDNNAGLRVVPVDELTKDMLGGGVHTDVAAAVGNADESHYDLNYGGGAETPSSDAEAKEAAVAEVMRTNQLTIDNPLAQSLSWEEIEELKKTSANSGRDLIQRLLEGHRSIDQKTPFSLHKYTQRKASKFLRRFSVHRLTVSTLCDYLPTTKEPYKYMEIRNQHLGMVLSLGNVVRGGRYLLIDETGGLLVAAVAERLGILEAPPPPAQAASSAAGADTEPQDPEPKKRKPNPTESPTHSTITLIHANEQPNLSLLSHFGYDANTPPPSHPLFSHVKSLTWLQLLAPEADMSLVPPPTATPEEIAAMKPGKRSAHHRKFRRWQKMSATVAEAREGDFDAVLIAGHISAPGVLKALVPLVRGSGQVVVYTPTLEQATEIADFYSSARRAQWILNKNPDPSEAKAEADGETGLELEEEDFTEWSDETPDPTLVLAPTVHRVNVRQYQVLPGRTHPLMTGRGGAEGYLFHGTRVVPVAGRVDARGAYASQKKKRRTVARDGGEAGATG